MADNNVTKTVGDTLGNLLAKPFHKLAEWGAQSRLKAILVGTLFAAVGGIGTYYLGPDNGVTKEAEKGQQELVVVDPSATEVIPPATIEK